MTCKSRRRQTPGSLSLSLLLLLTLALPGLASANCDSDDASVHCGAAPSATFDEAGNLWVAFVQDTHVYVARSADSGGHFDNPVRVTPEPEDAEYNGENRPKIIVSGDTVLVSWTLKTSPTFTGEIRFARSTDAGRRFSRPVTINDDGLFTGHRFESMLLTESGHLYLAWLDKRDLEQAAASDENYAGAAVYYTVSTDLGATFPANRLVAAHSCECCRIAMAHHDADGAAIFWRQIFAGGIRDHALTTLSPSGENSGILRATYDDWRIDACPHHGPAMIPSTVAANTFHTSWFSNGDLHQGIYYARFSLADGLPERVVSVDATPGAGHPSLAEFDGFLYLAWKGFDGYQSLVQVIRSRDDGGTWSRPRTLAATSQGSDHPLLVTGPDGVYLSWKSEELGFVFKPVAHLAGD